VNQITTLLFDFGATLDGPLHWLDRFLAQYRASGIEVSRSELEPAFDHATRTGYAATKVLARFGLTDLVRFLVGQQFEYLRLSGPDKVRAMLEESGPKGRHRIVEAVTTLFVRETAAGLEHSRALMPVLKNRFKLGVVSNFYGNLDRVLTETHLLPFFDVVVDSSRIGIFKPDPAIFQAALKQLHAPAATAAVIGDSIGKDCAPARKLGMRTVWLCANPQGVPSADTSVVDLTIHSLDEVARLEW
jgi:HAD superfamily hydrolase (TIGR01509 family)